MTEIINADNIIRCPKCNAELDLAQALLGFVMCYSCNEEVDVAEIIKGNYYENIPQ